MNTEKNEENFNEVVSSGWWVDSYNWTETGMSPPVIYYLGQIIIVAMLFGPASQPVQSKNDK